MLNMWVQLTQIELADRRKSAVWSARLVASVLWLAISLFISAFRSGMEILHGGGNEWVGFAEFLSRLALRAPVGIAVIWFVPWSRFKSFSRRTACETCGLEPISAASVVCQCGGGFIDTTDKKWIEDETNAA